MLGGSECETEGEASEIDAHKGWRDSRSKAESHKMHPMFGRWVLAPATFIALIFSGACRSAETPAAPSTKVAAGAPFLADRAISKVISGTLVLPDGTTVWFMVRELSVLAVRRNKAEPMYAFSPAVDERSVGVAWLALDVTEEGVFQISEGESDPQPPRSIVLGNVLRFTSGIGPLRLAAESVEVSESQTQPVFDMRLRPQDLLEKHSRSGGGTCCVDFDPWSVCASAVRTRGVSCRVEGIRLPNGE